MKGSAIDLMKLLGDRDFEILFDFVFTTSGWRGVSIVGKTRKTLDLDLILPRPGQAFVQVSLKRTATRNPAAGKTKSGEPAAPSARPST
ncbi:MAG: hypothetical protein H0V18_05345 [Pyrinomonadaceae bacterium]|nr:hypothetical protein [Pyrinomonadaceae bacterium]